MEVSILVGIGGTIAGYVVAAYFSERRLKIQLEHDERTRFHDMRVENYEQFSRAASIFVSEIQNGKPPRTRDIVIAYQKLLIIGSPSVRQSARDIYNLTVEAKETSQVSKAFIRDKFIPALEKFLADVRKELGVDKFS